MSTYTNRLSHEKSPYLLQHAHNPVNWYPWGEEAFQAARDEDKPIFLSIGYATCHWCHVMERESFENEEIAGLLNDAFICIKVDREERPDIDEIYMTVCQMMTRSGGWPLSIVLTPDRQPFFAATYIPPEDRFGRTGLIHLIPRISDAWKTRRDELLDSAKKITADLSRASDSAGELDAAVLDQLIPAAQQSFDAVYGGFGLAPKFPTAHRLTLLVRQNPAAAREMVLTTLSALRRGGIWDHVGHGIHRYSTDRLWLVPHFEKMLYDQAMLSLACAEAYEAYGDESAKQIAEELFDYVLRDMTSPGGGFYSAEDADSEGVEGKFYVWSMDELREVLSEEELALVVDRFNVQPDGNFRDEASGKKASENILHLTGEERVPEAIRHKLYTVREQRIHPLKDTKVLADWNGLMIAALAKAARVFDEPKYAVAAQRAAGFVFDEMGDGDRLWHRWREGETAVPGQLDDYAFMIFGLLEIYESTFDVRALEKAVSLNAVVIDQFADETSGGFYLTADDAESLITRPKSLYDGAIPSGNSVQMMNLLRLARMTGTMEYEALADQAGNAFAEMIHRAPSGFSQALQAVQFAKGTGVEVVIVGDRGSVDTKDMIQAVRSVYLPHRVVVLKDGPAIEKLAPYTAEQKQIAGRATVYICRSFACEQPLTDSNAVRSALEQGALPSKAPRD